MIKKLQLKRVVFEFENGYLQQFSGLEVQSVFYTMPGTSLNQKDCPNAIELEITLAVRGTDNQGDKARKLLRLADILQADSFAIQLGDVGIATGDYDIELEAGG